MTDQDKQERQRLRLLRGLFGPEVPNGLDGRLLRTADVASLFQVSERTVSEWARRGRLPSVRTPGGHRRYPAEQIRLLLRQVEEGDHGPEPAAVTDQQTDRLRLMRGRQSG